MTKQQKIWFGLGVAFFTLFVVFTLVVAFVDVDQVGLSHLNRFFWQHLGKNQVWKRVTDVLGYVTILGALGMVVWQIVQWVQRKSWRKVDWNLWCFDIVCAGLVAVYALFEFVVVNYRPEMVNGVWKASYPSSHAMLFATILPLLIWQVWRYLKSKPLRMVLTVVLAVLLVVGLVGRMLSGVHWFTDILAGVIVSCSLLSFYMVLAGKNQPA